MILVTGVNGQLGYDVVKVLTQRNMPCQGIDIQDLDITDETAVLSYIEHCQPELVMHCAAYTAVDRAEDELTTCTAVNVEGTRYIAKACQKVGAKMMYISTDYVFSGEGESAFQVEDTPAPTSAYGRTKLAGEEVVRGLLENHYIVRISWVFGINGGNFVKTMLRLGKEKESLTVVADQIGSPTYTADLAVLLCEMIETEHYGTYHATNEDYCSWADFAQAIMEEAGLSCAIQPIPTSQYPTKATRPLNSRLSKESLDEVGLSRLPEWRDALKRYLVELGESQ